MTTDAKMVPGDNGQGPGQVLFDFVRHWCRRAQDGGSRTAEQGRLVLATQAVHCVSQREPATINAIADELGIDQSGASRLISAAAAAGYLQMVASSEDGRRRQVTVNPKGMEMLRQAYEWQDAVFERLTETWSHQERTDFATAMRSMLESSHGLDLDGL